VVEGRPGTTETVRQGNEKSLEKKKMKWQKCPKCDGQGIVSKPPYLNGEQQTWTAASSSFLCDVCGGKKIILTPE
jgi:Zn finger protein HypA/HybF involved in hydrogenase expression